MPILAYFLLFIALGVIAYGMTIKAGGITKVPFYKPDPNVDIKEEQLVKFASKNIILIGVVDLIVAIAMMLTLDNFMFDVIIFAATLMFTGFIFLSIRFAAKVLVVPKN
ncbi:MAG: hypothetical protein A4E32_01673 [Methanomassiliicoccales archaeon PtaU1.Bin124]|nr:MAG: hypothetical protein A4E32_01673 [Methanomassiliicoccales archaeon PtaU1.Bin124]